MSYKIFELLCQAAMKILWRILPDLFKKVKDIQVNK